MKVLFLDIDGVLNNERTTEKVGVGRFAAFMGLDKVLVKRLLDWLHGKSIVVVISSTWREDETQLELIRQAGIPFIGITPNMGQRGREIDAWLQKHGVTDYAILDDIQQFSPHQRPRFVKTSFAHGLRDKDLRAVEVILDIVPAA